MKPSPDKAQPQREKGPLPAPLHVHVPSEHPVLGKGHVTYSVTHPSDLPKSARETLRRSREQNSTPPSISPQVTQERDVPAAPAVADQSTATLSFRCEVCGEMLEAPSENGWRDSRMPE